MANSPRPTHVVHGPAVPATAGEHPKRTPDAPRPQVHDNLPYCSHQWVCDETLLYKMEPSTTLEEEAGWKKKEEKKEEKEEGSPPHELLLGPLEYQARRDREV